MVPWGCCGQSPAQTLSHGLLCSADVILVITTGVLFQLYFLLLVMSVDLVNPLISVGQIVI